MYSIRKSYNVFYCRSNHCVEIIKKFAKLTDDKIAICPNDASMYRKKLFIVASGEVNLLWQSWNNYWRCYWLANFYGGMGYKSNIPINNLGIQLNNISCRSEGKAIFLIMKNAGFNMRKYKNNFVPYYSEPTWGDLRTIEKCAVAYRIPGDSVLSALSALGDSAKHLQIIRNASIHICKDAMLNIKSNVTQYYSINSLKYPTDLIFSKRIGSSKIALSFWLDEMMVFLECV